MSWLFQPLYSRSSRSVRRRCSKMDPPSAAVTYHAGFEIVCLAAMGACASEFISWVLIYRKQEYQRLSASIEKAVRHTACTLACLELCCAPTRHRYRWDLS